MIVATFGLSRADATTIDDMWPQTMDDASAADTDSSSAPFALSKPLSVEVDESDFGFTGFSSIGEDAPPPMITTRAPEFGPGGGARKFGNRRRLRQRKGKNGNRDRGML